MYVNLLPESVRARIYARGLLRRFVVVWGMVALAVCAVATSQTMELLNANRQLRDLTVQCEPLRALEKQIRAHQQRLKILAANHEKLQQLQPVNLHLPLLQTLVKVSRTEQGRVQIHRLAVSGGHSSVGRPASSIPPVPQLRSETLREKGESAPTGYMTIQAVAEDDAVVARFVAALRNSQTFLRVDLKSSSHVPNGDGLARQFQLECSFEDVL